MSERKAITYSKELRAKAKADGKAMFAVGCDDHGCSGAMTGPIDKSLGWNLFHFGALLHIGKKPEAAFKKAFLDKPKEKHAKSKGKTKA